MPLQTTEQYPGMVPDMLGQMQLGQQTGALSNQERNRQLLFQQSQEALGARKRMLGVPDAAAADETQAQAQQRVIAMDPDTAAKILSDIGVVDQRQKEELASFATNILAAPPEMRNKLIGERIREVAARDGDPSHTMMLLDLPQDQLEAAMIGAKSAALTELQRSQQAARGGLGAVDQVQSSSMLPGGVVQIVRKSGAVETISPDEAASEIIQRAEQRGVSLQQKRAQGRGLGADAAKVSAETAKQVGNLRTNNVTLRQVIDEVRGGAETGPLAAKLPSFRAESVRLDQLRNRLGLDVVGSVTFGALSEGELALALDTALPTKLDGPELIQWADDKIAAQEKLANYLEDQSIFLSRSGNTPAGWLEAQRIRGETQAQQQAAPQTAALPPGVTEDDITETMRANNMTRQQVLDRLGGM